MAAKKRAVKQQPLLNTVARKLGHAAGQLTKVTQELAESLSLLPESVSTKARKAPNVGASQARSRKNKKKVRQAVRPRKQR
jgi:hypothetical protein